MRPTEPTRCAGTDADSPSEEPSAPAETHTRRASLPPEYDSSSVQPASSENSSGEDSKAKTSPSLAVHLWRTIKSIFFASTPAWQFLKSGALFFFGLFCWSAANLLLSYEPTWDWVFYVMAYGFLLIGVGPLTHLLLVPHIIPWLRRQTRGTWLHTLGRHLMLTTFALFFAAVLWMGLSTPPFMQIDFQAALSSASAEITPRLVCSSSSSRADPTVTCHLEQTEGVGFITVESGERQLLQEAEPPFSFSVQRKDLVEVLGEHQFQVVVHDTEGATARRFTRTLSMIR